jgi:hypothetical protein
VAATLAAGSAAAAIAAANCNYSVNPSNETYVRIPQKQKKEGTDAIQ